jgi:hypothetical protein
MNLDMLWINPTFVWGQLLGGFLLGVGFIMSGLCPGTSVVSAASGRWDAVVTLLGIFVGTAGFAVAADVFPALERLYGAGSMDVSLIHELLGVHPLLFALGVIVVAGAGFAGAEKVEEIFSARYEGIELSPAPRPRMKLRLVGALALVALVGMGMHPSTEELPAIQVAAVDPLTLAEAIIRNDPGLLILDVRADAESAGKRVPGSYPATTAEAAEGLLATAPVGATVVLVDEDGALKHVPDTWRRDVDYRYLQDGFLGWELMVLTPTLPGDTQDDFIQAARQGQIAAYFSGAAVQAAVAAPPPMAAAGGGGQPKKKGGC